MPAAKGKHPITIVVPEAVKEAWDAEAAARGMDRSALILSKMQASGDEQGTWAQVMVRLDHQDRQLTGVQDALAQLVTSLQELVSSLQTAPATPEKKVYPTPATLEDTYPELKAMRTPVDQKVLLETRLAEHRAANPPVPEKKGWRSWRP